MTRLDEKIADIEKKILGKELTYFLIKPCSFHGFNLALIMYFEMSRSSLSFYLPFAILLTQFLSPMLPFF